MSIEAELRSPLATTQLVQFEFPEPIDHRTLPVRGYRLDLCLTPRPDNARACYLDHWNSRRFERLGNLFMQPAGEILHTRSDGCCRQTSLMCELNPEPINEWFEEDLQWTDNRLLESLDLRDANIQAILLRLAQEVRQPGIASEVMVEMMVGQLVDRRATGRGRRAPQPGRTQRPVPAVGAAADPRLSCQPGLFHR